MGQDLQPLLPSLPDQSRAAPFYLLSFSYTTLTWEAGKTEMGPGTGRAEGSPQS